MEVGLGSSPAFEVKVCVDFRPADCLRRDLVKLSLRLLPASCDLASQFISLRLLLASCDLTSQSFHFVYSQ